MKVFISHKKEDSEAAKLIQQRLSYNKVASYLDLLDNAITTNGKALTDHIKNELNDCTDILVVISENTRYSQWVPFEVGMSAQINLPTVTFLAQETILPSFLSYWPRLRTVSDVDLYVRSRDQVAKSMFELKEKYPLVAKRSNETEMFYSEFKKQLSLKSN